MFEGHAFMVEAAVSIGGRDAKSGITAYRFANRIPLLFEVSKLTLGRDTKSGITPYHFANRIPLLFEVRCCFQNSNSSLAHPSTPALPTAFCCCLR